MSLRLVLRRPRVVPVLRPLARYASTARVRASTRPILWPSLIGFSLAALTLAPIVRADDGPRWKREEVSVVLVIGAPRAGTTTVAKMISQKFGMELLSGDLGQAIEKAKGDGKLRVVLDNLSAVELDRFEKDVVPLLLIVFVDTPVKAAIERGGDARDIRVNHKRWEDSMRGVIARFREVGNILEITGQWPADEVEEQVTAKLESAIELEERGELFV